MKLFFALIFFTITSDKTFIKKEGIDRHCKFSLHIWDYNYSLAYTTYYKINSDSISVTAINGVQGGSNKLILSRVIKDAERKAMYDFLSAFPLDKIDTAYKNPLVEDGDQKRIEIDFRGKKKVIDIENFYQKDMAELFNKVNEFLEKNSQIYYKK
jgi:hypothetical protein